MHKFSTRSNHVRVELKISSRLVSCLVFITIVAFELRFQFNTLLFFLNFPKPPGSLLVEFGSGSNSVNSQVNQFLGFS